MCIFFLGGNSFLGGAIAFFLDVRHMAMVEASPQKYSLYLCAYFFLGGIALFLKTDVYIHLCDTWRWWRQKILKKYSLVHFIS